MVSASPSATASPKVTVSASLTASPMAVRDGPLPAGTYVWEPSEAEDDHWTGCPQPDTEGCSDPSDPYSIRFSFTLPDGWSGPEISPADVKYDAPDGAAILFTRGNWLYSDPCRHDDALADVPVGPTVDDFADALADHPLLDVTAPTDVTLGGYSGKYVELQVPSDIAECDIYRPWGRGLYAQGPSNRWRLWILDVDGLRVVVQASDFPGTSQQHRDELQAIVDSIRIER